MKKLVFLVKSLYYKKEKLTKDKVPSTSDKTPYMELILCAMLSISIFIISKKNRT